MTILYHYTCGHTRVKLGSRTATLRPNTVPGLMSPLVWLTDLDKPIADALGLTSLLLLCDRTEHRYRVTDNTSAARWISVRRRHPLRHALESAPGARPMHWWVSSLPVPVIYDPLP